MTQTHRSIFYTGLPVGAALLLLLAFFFALTPGAVAAPEAPNAPTSKIIVNEFLRSGNLNTTDEWIELLLVQDLTAAELEGFYVGDSTSSTAAKYSGYKFTDMSGIAANFPKGTIIVIGGDTAFTEDTSFNPSGNDWNLSLQTNGSHITGNGSAGDLAGTDVVYVDTNGTNGDTNISADGFAVNWDSTPGTLGSNANVTIPVPTNGTGAALFSGLDGSDITANWTTSIVTTSLTLGLPNGGDNTTYIESLRSGGTTTSDLTIAKTGPSVAVAGEDLVYELSVSSQNIDPATNVVVTDTLPVSTTLVSASGGFTQTNPTAGVYVWELGDVLSGTQVTFNVTVTVGANIGAGTVITNTAEVSTDAAGDDTTNNEVEHYATVYALTPIHDIQYVVDPGVDDASPYAGQTVMVQGIVYAVYGSGYFIADAAGQWNGLYVYNFSKPNVGDEVQVVGKIQEYYGLTELGNIASQVVLSTGNTLYGPAVVTAAEIPYDDVAASEAYEGVFVEIHDLTVLTGNDSYRQWTFTDISQATGKVDDWGYDANPAVGDVFTILRGALVYDFSEYKVLPRNEDDVVPPAALLIEKDAASNVSVGGLLTYTITIENITGDTLTDINIIDVVPTTTTLNAVLDGGVSLGGTTVSWDIASLANRASTSVRFVVEALNYPGQTIMNDLYYVQAANWVTQTFGAPVESYIGDYIPIPTIQGLGFRSPYEGTEVTTQGEVIGFFKGNSSAYGNFDGFFIQDSTGDGDAATSDGIFVNYKKLAVSVNLGDMVEVTGVVNEFDEYDGTGCYGNECLTQVTVSNAGDVTILTTQLTAPQAITATELNPPGDVAASDIYFEALEGMLVTLPNTSTVVAPTNYGAVSVVRGDLGIDRVIRTGPYEGMPLALRNWELYGDFNGGDAPDLIVGSVVSNADGPLGFSYGDYMIITQDGDEWVVESAATPPATVPSWPEAGATQFSVGTFNTYNFDNGASSATMMKVVNTIASFNGAAFVALEEIEGDNPPFMGAMLTNLATAGYNYDYAYSHPDTGGHGVALLWNTDLVSNVSWSTEYQDCSPYGSSSSSYDPLWYSCRTQDEYPLFSRRPVVVTGTLSLASGDLEVVVIANHFKSKAGNDPSADQRRLEQGMFVNSLVADFVANGSKNVIVMGDLNDFEDSPALLALTANDTLINAWTTYAADDPYSYIYEGVSQILDHILVSEALYGWLVDMGALHLNADYPYNTYYDDPANIWHTSDHDPVAATIQLPYLLYMPLIFGGD